MILDIYKKYILIDESIKSLKIYKNLQNNFVLHIITYEYKAHEFIIDPDYITIHSNNTISYITNTTNIINKILEKLIKFYYY